MLASFSFFFNSGEFLLHIPCWLELYLGSFTYTPSARFIFLWGVSLTHPMLALLSGASFLFGEFLLHIPCWLHVYVGSFSYTSRVLGSFFYASNAGFTFMWGVSLTHPVLASFLSGQFLLHIPCWLHSYMGSFSFTARGGLLLKKKYLGSFSYTSRAGFMFMWGVSLTHPEFWGVSFTHPMLVSALPGEFLLHIPCWFHFHVGSFSYTSQASFRFPSGVLFHIPFWWVSLTHPTLSFFLNFFIWAVSLTRPMLAFFFFFF